MVIDFSDRLRELRLEKGYSQATLSQKITNLGQPLSEAALAKYESGRTIPNLQVAAYLADYFGVSIDYLACGEKASVLSTEGLKRRANQTYCGNHRCSAKAKSDAIYGY